MDHLINKLKRSIMSVSFQERRKKELKKYRKEVNRLNEMDDDEIDLEYITLKAQYEHKKNILSIFMLTILISFLMNAWERFYHLIEITMQLVTSDKCKDIQTTKVVFILTVILIAFLTILVPFVLISHAKSMYQIYKKLLTVEEMRKKVDYGK